MPFALLAIRESVEILNSNPPLDLSAQCLYYHCKARDNDPNDYSWVHDGLAALITNGVCEEGCWPYNDILDPHNISQGPFQKGCGPYPCQSFPHACTGQRKQHYKIKSYNTLTNSTDIKCELLSHKAVIANIPVFKRWEQDPVVEATGQIVGPFAGDDVDSSNHIGNQTICIVGYNDIDSSFFFKNSWGTSWGYISRYGSGYGEISYRYIDDRLLEAYSINC